VMSLSKGMFDLKDGRKDIAFFTAWLRIRSARQ
jgi:hypothetical protein